MRCIAHRGFAGVNPENTVAAVRAAARAGADAVEVDARRCGSGEVVVLHDETVDRVTDATGPVADYSVDELRSLRVLDSHEGIPSLHEVYAALPADVEVNVELKEGGLGEDVVAVASEYDNGTVLSSFEELALREAASAGATRLAFLAGRDTEEGIDRARDIGCEAIHPQWTLCRPGYVERARAAGLTVNAWTVQSRAVGYGLGVLGVDGLISDAPAYC